MDITELKAQLFQENVHNSNPALFKKVNDLAKDSNFQGELNQNDFIGLLMAQQLLSKRDKPSLYDMVLIFEMLDEDKTGMISA